MIIKPIIFGKYKLTIQPKSSFTGNAVFSKSGCGVDEFESICKIISEELNRDFTDQKGKGCRYWRLEEDAEVQKLQSLANYYNSGET